MVAAGKLRALAYAARERSPLMPNVPTVAEMGLPGLRRHPVDGHDRARRDAAGDCRQARRNGTRACTRRTLLERFKRDGVDPVGGTPEAFAAQITKEITQWRDVAQSSKIND